MIYGFSDQSATERAPNIMGLRQSRTYLVFLIPYLLNRSFGKGNRASSKPAGLALSCEGLLRFDLRCSGFREDDSRIALA